VAKIQEHVPAGNRRAIDQPITEHIMELPPVREAGRRGGAKEEEEMSLTRYSIKFTRIDMMTKYGSDSSTRKKEII
jgi:hypothetical protein